MTTAPDTEFFRAFAGRVRTQLSTTIPGGNPTMTTITAETTEVPATFLPAPDAPCQVHPWCEETGAHVDHFSQRIALAAASDKPTILSASLYTDRATGDPELWWDLGCNTDEPVTGEQLREQTAWVRAHLARLDALADQYDAICEASGEPAAAHQPVEPEAEQPETWSFIESEAGAEYTVTCMTGCTWSHEHDQKSPTSLDDIYCMTRSNYGAELPVDGPAESTTILGAITRVQPWHNTMPRRLPHVSVEITDDVWVEGLDPDGLQVVIDTFQSRLDELRKVRTRLIEIRSEYVRRPR